MSGDTFIISGLRGEALHNGTGRMVDLRRELDRLQADLVHIDAVLRLYGLEPAEIPTRDGCLSGPPILANEISRRCREALREKGTVRADEITVRAMKDKDWTGGRSEGPDRL